MTHRLLYHFNRNAVVVVTLLLSISLAANDPPVPVPVPVRVSIATLQMSIVGSIVSKTKTSSVVLLKYLTTNEVKAHRVGSVLLGKYTLFEITEKSITLQSEKQGHTSLTIAYQDKFFQELKKAAPAALAPTGASDSYKENGFERDHGEIRITEAYKNDLLSPSKLTETLLHAAAEPYIKDGQMLGFKLDLIDEGSIYSKSGLVNGDVITEINGTPLTDAASAIRLLQSLRNAKSLSLSFLRGGVVTPLNISVQ